MKIFSKSDNRGFGHVELLVFVVVVLLITGIGLYDAHRHFSNADASQGSALTSSSTPLFQNPFRDIKNLDPWRIDEGVDYHGVGPVYAVGPGVVTGVNIATRNSPTCTYECESHFWYKDGGNDVIYRITKGLAKNEYIYVAEACTPLVNIGDKVTSTTKICHMYGGEKFPGIETGEWNGATDDGLPSSKPLAAINGEYAVDGDATAYGVNMNQRLVSLGALAGNTTKKHPHVSPYVSNPGHYVGNVPATWPVKWIN